MAPTSMPPQVVRMFTDPGASTGEGVRYELEGRRMVTPEEYDRMGGADYVMTKFGPMPRHGYK
jgi:hypothetical protein